MKLNPIEVNTPFGLFIIDQSDWESVGCPICMQCVTEEEWQNCADYLGMVAHEYNADNMTPHSDEWRREKEFMELDLWEEYENYVMENCKYTFYYEDAFEDFDEPFDDEEIKKIARKINFNNKFGKIR